MKIVGLIAEYNPFHAGHFYHMKRAKELTGADAALVVMSGDFVQRGAPAIMPKHLRARMALNAGADVVIELPVCFACASAEYFAAGAVSILNQLGCIDSVCFGSECGDISLLEQIAHILANEPKQYKLFLQSFLRAGNPFPRARQMALQNYLKDDSMNGVLAHPNNILGIEYIKALISNDSSITPYTITRQDSSYHNEQLTQKYSSASAIRRHITGLNNPEEFAALNTHIPENCFDILKETFHKRYPVLTGDFSLLLKYKLLHETSESLMNYLDITEEIANRIINRRNEYICYEQFCDTLKTKDITYSRISRCLLHVLLNITSENMEEYKDSGFCQYARFLGFRRNNKEILSRLKKHSQIPLITKLTDTDSLGTAGIKMLKKDMEASDLYESMVTDKFRTEFVNEYQKKIVIL